MGGYIVDRFEEVGKPGFLTSLPGEGVWGSHLRYRSRGSGR